MFLLYVDSCTDNSFCLHLSNFWISNCKTASSVSHHGFTLSFCKFLDICFFSWNELMKRWIKETNCNWVTFQCFVKCFEVSLLIWKNLLKSSFSFFYCIRADHLTECSNSVFLKEHMLCTAKSDTFCTKLTSFLSICWSIGICQPMP